MKKILLYCLISVTAQRGLAQTADEETLKQLNRDFGNAIVNGDSASLSRILADDFLMVNPGGQTLTKKDNLAIVASSGVKYNSLTIDSVRVRIATPEIGIITCWQTFRYTTGGKAFTGKNCYQDVYRKKDGTWQAISAQVTPLSTK